MKKKYKLYVKSPVDGKSQMVREGNDEDYDSMCKEWTHLQSQGLTAFIWQI
ncbi:MAG: hypothetical protein J5767_12840 [Paludibacteraceae bacterium]|jgi:hypothetical protein|nr:hypothetical protein [Paludibacteraceae bacterium]MBO7694354.1 hypothetical protein [Methanobrevibacter sp.]